MENELKKLIKDSGLTYKFIYDRLGIDIQKFGRWSQPNHPNFLVLKCAVKYLIRYVLQNQIAEEHRKVTVKEDDTFEKRVAEVGGL